MDVTIVNLKDCPEIIPRLAILWYEVLGSVWITSLSLEQVEQGFYSELSGNSLPLTLVALKGTEVIGSVSLLEHDEVRVDLTPWLESIVVAKAYQKQGIGRLLVQKIKQKARDLEFKRLYLFAYDAHLVTYYERLGFQSLGIGRANSRDVILMESSL